MTQPRTKKGTRKKHCGRTRKVYKFTFIDSSEQRRLHNHPHFITNWSCCDLQSSRESIPRLGYLVELETSLIPFCCFLPYSGKFPSVKCVPMQSLLLSGAENTMSAFLLNRLLVQNISAGQCDFPLPSFFLFCFGHFRVCEIDFTERRIEKVA